MLVKLYSKLSSNPFFKNVSTTFLVQLLSGIVVFLLHIQLSKILGISDYGFYVYILAITMPIGMIAGYGLNVSLVKFINQYLVSQQMGSIKGLLRFSFLFTVLTSSIAVVIACVCLFYLVEKDVELYGIAFLMIPFNALNGIVDSMFKAKKKYTLAYITSSLVKPLTMLLVVSILHFDLSVKLLFWMHLLLSAGLLLFNMSFGYHMYAQEMKTKARYEIKTWMRTSTSMFLSNISFRLMNYSDAIIIRTFLGDASTGFYNLMSRCLVSLDMVTISVNSIKTQDFTRLFYSNKMDALRRDFFHSRNTIVFLSAALAICLFTVTPFIFSYIGHDFSKVLLPFFILISSKLLSAFAGSSGVLLNMTDREILHMKINFISLFIYLIPAVLLTKHWGLTGMAFAALLGTGSVNLIKHHYVLNALNATFIQSINRLLKFK